MFKLKELFGLVNYTSPLDQFLAKFDHEHPKLSESQYKEQQKYARIYKLRDNANATSPAESFWDNFRD